MKNFVKNISYVHVVFAFFYCLCFSCSAENKMSAEAKEIINCVENYLNSVKTLRAIFVQEVNKELSSGLILLKREKNRTDSKMRFEYNLPKANLLIIRNDKLFYHDKQLDEVSELGIDYLPISFILDSNINLHNFTVLGITKKLGLITIKFCKKDDYANGNIEIFFKTENSEDKNIKNLRLVKWVIRDENQKTVAVTISELKINKDISDQEILKN